MLGTKCNPFLLVVLAVEPWALRAVDMCIFSTVPHSQPQMFHLGTEHYTEKNNYLCYDI